jgi:hypothetical protein
LPTAPADYEVLETQSQGAPLQHQPLIIEEEVDSPRTKRYKVTCAFQASYKRENLEPVKPEECFRNGEWTKWVIERCNEEQKQMFYDMRERLAKAGLEYLSDNNVLRYLNSYLWNMDNTFMRLSNTEKWRRENDCMQVHRHEIENEIQMKVTNNLIMLIDVVHFYSRKR